jgi:hypothetical protein
MKRFSILFSILLIFGLAMSASADIVVFPQETDMTFKDQIAADLDVFINADEFGEAAVYQPLSGEAIDLTVIYDESYELVNPETGVGIQSNQPLIMAKSASLAGITPGTGDQVTIRNETMRVIEVQPDGRGVTKILLHRAN